MWTAPEWRCPAPADPTDGIGTDRSWRVGADGEIRVAEVLAALTTASTWDRLRRRPAQWRVLHSVPLLVPILRGMTTALGADDVEAVFALARRSTTWAAPTRCARAEPQRLS